jgi:hypothetical protein
MKAALTKRTILHCCLVRNQQLPSDEKKALNIQYTIKPTSNNQTSQSTKCGVNSTCSKPVEDTSHLLSHQLSHQVSKLITRTRSHKSHQRSSSNNGPGKADHDEYDIYDEDDVLSFFDSVKVNGICYVLCSMKKMLKMRLIAGC